jgi:hypothetical protein
MAESAAFRWQDRLLDEVATEFAYPPAPELGARVLVAVAERPPVAAAARTRRLRFAYAAAAALLLAFALTLAVEPARTAIAEFFGLVEGARIEILPPAVETTPTPTTPPTATPTGTPAPTPTAAGTTPPPSPSPVLNDIADVADPVTLAAAAATLGFDPALPPGYGEPAATYVLRRLPGVVVLQYDEFDLWQSRSSSIFVGKGVPANLLIDTPLVQGEPSYWIEGGRHFMRFLDEGGETIAGTERTVDRDTLIWRSGETFYRLETDLPQAEAITIAESLP